VPAPAALILAIDCGTQSVRAPWWRAGRGARGAPTPRSAAAMTGVGRHAEPQPAAAALHDELHRAVVAWLSGRLAPL